MTVKVPTFCGWNVEASSQQLAAPVFYCNLSSLNRITCFCQVYTRHFILLKYGTLDQYESYFSAPTGYENVSAFTSNCLLHPFWVELLWWKVKAHLKIILEKSYIDLFQIKKEKAKTEPENPIKILKVCVEYRAGFLAQLC